MVDCATDDDTLDTPVAQDPAIQIIKSLSSYDDNDSSGTITLGDGLWYGFAVSNTGNVTLDNIDVTDNTFGIAVTCVVTTLAPGESTTCTADAAHTVTLAEANAGNVQNTATTTGDCPGAVVDCATDDDTLDTPVAQDPAIQIIKSLSSYDDNDSSGTITLGDGLWYGFAVSNTGNVTLDNIDVTDNTFGIAVTCVVTTLAPGESTTCTADAAHTVTLAEANAGNVQNTATTTGDCPGAVVDCATDDDTLDTPVAQDPALSLVKTGVFNDESGDGFGQAGETISYTYDVTNIGNVTLTNLSVVDSFTPPGNLVNLSGITCSPIAQGGTLIPGATTQCTATYTLSQADVDNGQVDNLATADSNETDPVTDPETVEVPVAPPLPDLCIPNEIFAVDDPNRRNSIFFKIDLTGLGAFDCGDFHNGANFEGLESLNSVLYAASGETDTDFSGKDGYFYSVAADTCEVTEIGGTGFTDIEALAVHPDDTMWGFAEDEGLFTIDNLETAESTLRQASSTKIEALSWSLDGITLYGAGDSSLYTYECDTGSLVADSCTGGGWQLVTDQLPGEIEGMDTVREGEHFVPGQDVLLLGAHDDDKLYYWNVDTGSLMGTLSTGDHPDVEGLVVCKDD